MAEPVPVRVRDCACPGQPHGEEGDIVFLAPTPSLACGLAAQADMVKAAGDGSFLAQLWQVTYLRHGAVAWNFLDARGKPLPFDVEAILADYSIAQPAAEKADELYGEAVMRPLLNRLSTISPDGPTVASISPLQRSNRSQRRRSSPATTAAMRQRTG
jgi:hypothetical protein